MAVTIHDVAQAAGVSVATVSRVLHGAGTVNEQMCMRVRAAVRELGYVPNPVAQSLKQQCSRMIGITASDLSVAFFPEVVNGVEKAFSPKGYATIVSSTHDLPDNENTILQRMLARKVDALLVNSTGQNEDMLPFQREWVRPSMKFYLHFSLDMARSPGFGSNTTNFSPFSDLLSLRLHT